MSLSYPCPELKYLLQTQVIQNSVHSSLRAFVHTTVATKMPTLLSLCHLLFILSNPTQCLFFWKPFLICEISNWHYIYSLLINHLFLSLFPLLAILSTVLSPLYSRIMSGMQWMPSKCLLKSTQLRMVKHTWKFRRTMLRREKQSVERCMLELGKEGVGRDPANQLGSH